MRRVQHLYGKNLEETNEEKLQGLIKRAEEDCKQLQRQVIFILPLFVYDFDG